MKKAESSRGRRFLMTQVQLSQLQKIALLLFITLFIVFLYTFLHEAGHALVAIVSGGTITNFSVNFWQLSAHVDVRGGLSPAQTIVNNLAGAGLPVFVWLLFMVLVPKRANLALENIKVVGTLTFLSTLLAWIVLPLFFWAGQTLSDDVVNFLKNSGLHPLWVTSTALFAYLGGWLLFTTKIDGVRREIDLFRNGDEPVMTLAVRNTALSVIGLFAILGFVAFSANGYRLSAPRSDPFLPPQGYRLAKTVDLSQGEYAQSVIHSCTVDTLTVAGVYLLVENINSDYFEVRLTGPDQYDHLIIHAEGYTAVRDNPHIEDNLQAGQYHCVLTSKSSAGVLSIYIRESP